MRKFMINVNGNSYEVEVEEIRDGVAAPAPAPKPAAAPTPAPAKPAAAAPAPKPAAPAVPAGAGTINAPMPGTILSINVKPGDVVKKGEVLCILEAMKMENEIMAGGDATIASVNVNTG
ncbi:MAG TPA: biotin/lipoyl-containing protein, partial [Negativicutes bacterium]|nr:biotin/lipoyl-containing protein [Negativicutes bacterium]